LVTLFKEANGTYIIDNNLPLDVAGSYLTNYYLVKPQKNFHRAITVKLPLKAPRLENHTYHVFIASQGLTPFF